RLWTISPRPSRTVTGVVTSATRTLISFLGGCCTGTPGFGGSGPVAACPNIAAASNNRLRSSPIARHPSGFIPFLPFLRRPGLPSGSVLDSTHLFRKTLPQAARNSYNLQSTAEKEMSVGECWCDTIFSIGYRSLQKAPLKCWLARGSNYP